MDDQPHRRRRDHSPDAGTGDAADETITVPTSAVVTAATQRRVRCEVAAPVTEHVSCRWLIVPPKSNAHGKRAARTHRESGLRTFVPGLTYLVSVDPTGVVRPFRWPAPAGGAAAIPAPSENPHIRGASAD